MTYTLAIIDMQSQFGAANNPDLKIEVMNAIERAMQDDAAIAFVEYGVFDHNTDKVKSNNPTFKSISTLAKGYKKKTKVIKLQDGGGNELVTKLRTKKFPVNTIKFCGVNLSYCVAQTVTQTMKMLPHSKIEILKDATGDEDYDSGVIYGGKTIKKRANGIFQKNKNMRII